MKYSNGSVRVILIGLVIILLVIGGLYFYFQYKSMSTLDRYISLSSGSPIYSSTTNGVSNAQLVKIALEYAQNPQVIFFEGKQISSSDLKAEHNSSVLDLISTCVLGGVEYVDGTYRVRWDSPRCSKGLCFGGDSVFVFIQDLGQNHFKAERFDWEPVN